VQKATRWKWLHQSVWAGLAVYLIIVAYFVLNNVFAAFAISPVGRMEPRFLIPGHLVPALRHHVARHATESNSQINLSVALNLRNTDALDRLIAAQNDPHSSLYHHYITPQEFVELFGPRQFTVDTVVAYLRSQGLAVRSVAANHLLVNASGSATNVERAFAVSLNDYVVDGRTVYAPVSEPSVPASLAGMIQNISGLSNITYYHRLDGLHDTAGTKPGLLHAHVAATGGYTPAELRAAYDMNPLFENNADGRGQTIALFELDGYSPKDINRYLAHYNLGAPKYSDVLVDGATNTPGYAAIEVEMDMETVSAIAPGAEQKIYIGQNDPISINDTFNRIVTDNIAKVVSTSWGACESLVGSAELAAMNSILKQGAAQGQAFFAASGDFGAYDCGSDTLAVDAPADNPFVVAVGGTSLLTGINGTYASENAWSCITAICREHGTKGAGSGGGISRYFMRSAYQRGPNLTNSMRVVPDVSAEADPAPGYSIYCTVTASGCPNTGWVVVGGTSAAVELWAAMAVDINQYLINHNSPTLGSASALLYTLYNTPQTYPAYHDVVAGSNLYYPATPGYDLATGVGSPDAWNIARDLTGRAPTGNTGAGVKLPSLPPLPSVGPLAPRLDTESLP
jgi:kumamolisin